MSGICCSVVFGVSPKQNFACVIVPSSTIFYFVFRVVFSFVPFCSASLLCSNRVVKLVLEFLPWVFCSRYIWQP